MYNPTCTESFPAAHRCDLPGLTSSVCAGGVGQGGVWTEDEGCSSRRIWASYLRLSWLVKENWLAKKCLILRIRMSGYMFFCWPDEVPCLPGPAIKLFRDYFSLWHQILCSLSQCLLVQRNVLGKSCPTCWRNLILGDSFLQPFYLPRLDQTTHITTTGCLFNFLDLRRRLMLLVCLSLGSPAMI